MRGFPCACVNCLTAWDIPGEEPCEPRPIPTVPDLRSVARSDPRAAGVVQGMYGSIRSLSVIPEVPRRVIALVHDPLADAGALAALIRDDSVLTMGILRLANSVAYAGRETTQDLKMACARVGLKRVASFMWTALNASVYMKGPSRFRPWLNRLWKHSAAAAECAELLAHAMHEPDDHLAYVGALLHDVGKVVLLQAICSLPGQAAAAFADARLDTETLVRTYHAGVGLHAVQYMKSAPEIRTTTLHHHSPQAVTEPRLARLTLLVAGASALATEAGYGAYPAETPGGAEEPGHPLLAELGLEEDAIQAIRDAIPERIEAILSTFAVG